MRRRQWTWRGRGYVLGLRRGEWWVGVRNSFMADAWEINFFGATLMIGKERRVSRSVR